MSYEAQVSYDAGGSWIGAYEGDRTTFEAVVGGSDQMKVRVRGVTPAGPRGAWSVVDVAAPSLIIGAGTVVLEPIDYEGLTQDVRNRLEHILEVEAYAQQVSAKALSDFMAADGKAQNALDRALEGLGATATNAAAIFTERTQRLAADQAFVNDLNVAVAKIGENTAAIATERTARTTADEAFASSLDSVRVIANGNAAAITEERTARANGDSASAALVSGLRVELGGHLAAINAYNVETRNVIASGDEALSNRITALGAAVGSLRSRSTLRVMPPS